MLNPVAFSCYKNLNLQKCEDSERTESRKPGKQTKGGFDLARQKDENREKAKQLFFRFRRLNEEYRNCGSLGD